MDRGVCLNKEGKKLTTKKWKVGFFNTFSGRLKAIFGVRFRNMLFCLSYFRRFPAPILTVFLRNGGCFTPFSRQNHTRFAPKSRCDLGKVTS